MHEKGDIPGRVGASEITGGKHVTFHLVYPLFSSLDSFAVEKVAHVLCECLSEPYPSFSPRQLHKGHAFRNAVEVEDAVVFPLSKVLQEITENISLRGEMTRSEVFREGRILPRQ